MSELVFWVFVPIASLFLHGMAFLTITTGLLLWHLSLYRWWTLFPSKIVFFLRLFSHIGLLLFNLSFLGVYISEHYFEIDTKILLIFGYLGLSGLCLTLILNLILAIVLVVQSIIRVCKTNNSVIESCAE